MRLAASAVAVRSSSTGSPADINAGGLTRALLALRRHHPALLAGAWTPIAIDSDVLFYARGEGEDEFLVALNLNSVAKTIVFEHASQSAKIILSTGLDRVDN